MRALRRAERALDAAAAAAKVSMVLALKMVVFRPYSVPVVAMRSSPTWRRCGLWVEGAAGAALARWVLGITFMLVVTVVAASHLQRRAMASRRCVARWCRVDGVARPQRDGVAAKARGRRASSVYTQVAVLQLREQLHPAVLGQWVRPHEPRPDLPSALLANGATHASV